MWPDALISNKWIRGLKCAPRLFSRGFGGDVKGKWNCTISFCLSLKSYRELSCSQALLFSWHNNIIPPFCSFPCKYWIWRPSWGQNKNTITISITLPVKYKIQLSADSRGKTFRAHRKSAFHYEKPRFIFFLRISFKTREGKWGGH